MSDGNEKGLDGLKLLDTTANPAPLGLLGFGMTTVLLNMHNAGFFALGSMILAMGIFYGGLAQIVAGIMEWKKNNTFGATAFFSYGCFWLSLVSCLSFCPHSVSHNRWTRLQWRPTCLCGDFSLR